MLRTQRKSLGGNTTVIAIFLVYFGFPFLLLCIWWTKMSIVKSCNNASEQCHDYDNDWHIYNLWSKCVDNSSIREHHQHQRHQVGDKVRYDSCSLLRGECDVFMVLDAGALHDVGSECGYHYLKCWDGDPNERNCSIHVTLLYVQLQTGNAIIINSYLADCNASFAPRLNCVCLFSHERHFSDKSSYLLQLTSIRNVSGITAESTQAADFANILVTKIVTALE